MLSADDTCQMLHWRHCAPLPHCSDLLRGFQTAAISLTGPRITAALRQQSERKRKGRDNYLELSQVSQHIKIHLINHCWLLPRWLFRRGKKKKTSPGLSVGKYMLVWCVLCRQVNRLADLISGEVVTGEASARIGCHIHFFPMQITVSRSPRFGMRPPERDTNQPDSVCVMFSAHVAQQITVLLFWDVWMPRMTANCTTFVCWYLRVTRQFSRSVGTDRQLNNR